MEEDKKWLFAKIALILGVVGIIVYGIYVNNAKRIDVSKYNKDQIITGNTDNGEIGDQIIGNPNAKIVAIEYGDYECPACATYRHIFKGLVENYPDQVVLIFRNFIIPGHTNARAASAAAIAAQLQGKPWEMYEKLYANQAEWGKDSSKRMEIFEKYAQEIGLNLEQFRTDIKSDRIVKKIAFDEALGYAHKVTATPSLVINGEQISSDIWGDETKLKQLIDEKLKN